MVSDLLLQMAAKAARKAIQDCDLDGNVLVASRLRQICHLIDDLNPSDEHDAHQRLLEQVIATSDNICRYPLESVGAHELYSKSLHCFELWPQMYENVLFRCYSV